MDFVMGAWAVRTPIPEQGVVVDAGGRMEEGAWRREAVKETNSCEAGTPA